MAANRELINPAVPAAAPVQLEAIASPKVTLNPRRWVKVGTKSGGANGCGPLGGWYVIFDHNLNDNVLATLQQQIKDEQDPTGFKPVFGQQSTLSYLKNTFPEGTFKLAFVKQDSTDTTIFHEKNIAEVVAGELMRWINDDDQDAFANVSFVDTTNSAQPSPTGESIYVVSEAITGFQDLFKAAAKYYDETVPADRPTLTPDYVKNYVASGNVVNLERVVLSCLFTGNVDVHSANIGVVADPTPENPYQVKAVTIDFAAALKNIDGKINFGNILKYLPGLGPTNHARDYPREVLVTASAANILEKIAKISESDLRAKLRQIMQKVARYYGLAPLHTFANWIDLTDLTLHQRFTNWINLSNVEPLQKEALIERIVSHLTQKLAGRTPNANELRLEFAVTLCYDENLRCDEAKLNDLINKNAFYFVNHLNSGHDFHFRKNLQKSARRHLSSHLRKMIKKNEHAQVFINEQRLPTSLRIRLEKAFNVVFHGRSRNERKLVADSGFAYFAKTMIGWPKGSDTYSYIEWVLPGLFGLVPLAKNLTKLVTDFLIFFMEELARQAAQHCKIYITEYENGYLPRHSISLPRYLLAHVALAVCIFAHYSLKALRLVLMRFTSPFASIKQAFHAGTHVGKKLDAPSAVGMTLGVLLGVLSAAVSLSLTALAYLAAAPLMAPLGAHMAVTVIGGKAVTGITASTNWFLANAPHVSQFAVDVGNLAVATLAHLGIQSVAGYAFPNMVTGLLMLAAPLQLFIILPVRTAMKELVNTATQVLRPLANELAQWLGIPSQLITRRDIVVPAAQEPLVAGIEISQSPEPVRGSRHRMNQVFASNPGTPSPASSSPTLEDSEPSSPDSSPSPRPESGLENRMTPTVPHRPSSP